MDTAADWLISITPQLAKIKAEELHDEHVAAWLDAPACEACGQVRPIVTRGGWHPQCQTCFDLLHAKDLPEIREGEQYWQWIRRVGY